MKSICVGIKPIMSKEMRFAIFCLESYKLYKKMSGKEVAKTFAEFGVFEYIKEFFDVLHTRGYEYVNRDIGEFIKNSAKMPLSQ